MNIDPFWLPQIVRGVIGGVTVAAVRQAIALFIVGKAVFASNQFMVGPAYFRLRLGATSGSAL